MIMDALKMKGSLTASEAKIADYLLVNAHDIRNLGISELARRTYSSPATITRLCRKLGLSGYRDFRIVFAAELEEASRRKSVDANLPFSATDPLREVAFSMANLAASAMNNALQSFDYRRLEGVVERMASADSVNIYAVGVSATAALDFKQKMVRLGKQTNIEENSSLLPSYAFLGGKDSFDLLISHSGETPAIVECVQILRSLGRRTLAITAHPQSTVARMADDTILTHVGEDSSFSTKIEGFASFNAVHFILDCLYCWVFQQNYETNVGRSKRNARRIAAVRQR